MAINNLSRRPKRNREPLGTAPTPEDIPASRNEQDRAVAEETSPGSGGGLLSPLTEQSRETQTLKVYDPSDATIWVEVEQITKLVMKDAAEVEIEFNFTPP